MFGNLIGNEPVKIVLRRLLESERLPNALLFAGPDGVGKKQFAFELGRALVCSERQDAFESCGECSACTRVGVFDIPKSEKKDDFKQVFSSAHPDVGMVVPFNRNILVDSIRDLEKEAYFLPYEAKKRFFIIDDADKMNDPASNALLKTLEEPPPTSHIVLIASRPDHLLPTIRSRCQTIRFAPVDASEIEEFLLRSQQVTPDDAMLAARLSNGSIGRALGTDIEKLRGQRDLMLDVLKNVIGSVSMASALQTSETINDTKNKDDYEEFLFILESLVRDLWLIKNSAGAGIVHFDIENQLRTIAEKSEAQHLAACLSEIELLRESFMVNINRKIATDSLFVKMAGA